MKPPSLIPIGSLAEARRQGSRARRLTERPRGHHAAACRTGLQLCNEPWRAPARGESRTGEEPSRARSCRIPRRRSAAPTPAGPLRPARPRRHHTRARAHPPEGATDHPLLLGFQGLGRGAAPPPRRRDQALTCRARLFRGRCPTPVFLQARAASTGSAAPSPLKRARAPARVLRRRPEGVKRAAPTSPSSLDGLQHPSPPPRPPSCRTCNFSPRAPVRLRRSRARRCLQLPPKQPIQNSVSSCQCAGSRGSAQGAAADSPSASPFGRETLRLRERGASEPGFFPGAVALPTGATSRAAPRRRVCGRPGSLSPSRKKGSGYTEVSSVPLAGRKESRRRWHAFLQELFLAESGCLARRAKRAPRGLWREKGLRSSSWPPAAAASSQENVALRAVVDLQWGC